MSNQCLDFEDRLLKPFKEPKFKAKLLECVGRGLSGFVFKVEIAGRPYLLKTFKFYDPRLVPSKFHGFTHRALYDHFLVECRANGSLIKQGNNGKYTAFCYGWVELSKPFEEYVARRFDIQPFLWERTPATSRDHIRGILFEFLEGKTLSRSPIAHDKVIADKIRLALRGLHISSIAHGDVTGHNIIVSEDKVKFVDLGSSTTLPHIQVSAAGLQQLQEKDQRFLEIGLSLRFSIRAGETSEFDFMKQRWWEA